MHAQHLTGLTKVALLVCLALPCVACDQATKVIARQALADGRPVELLAGVLRLQLVENPGAFLSLGASLPEPVRFLVLTIVPPALLLLMSLFVLRSPAVSRQAVCGAALLIGGGVGNLIDRLTQGAVVDFVNLGVGSLRTGIFNLSDVLILAGALLAATTLGDKKPGLDEAVGEP